MAKDVLTVEEDDFSDDSEREMSAGSDDSDGNETRVDGTPAAPSVAFPNEKKLKKKKLLQKKRLTRREESAKRRVKTEKLTRALVKPDAATDRDKERLLRRIATKGVVQLFNAVSERQRTMTEELQKKMTAKQRKATEEKLRGSTFNVYGEKRDVKNEDDEDEEMDTSVVKEENDEIDY